EGLQAFDFRRYWHSFVERIWIVAICVLAGLFLALGYLARTPKLYQGHTVLEVDFQEPTIIASDDAARMRSAFLASQEALRTIEQNLTNQTLLARVIRSEGLAEDDGRALLGNQNIASRSKSNATPGTGPSPGTIKTQSAVGVGTFTPLEEALGRALAGMVNP